MIKVRKRDGRLEKWNPQKLSEAVNKASLEANQDVDTKELIECVESYIQDYYLDNDRKSINVDKLHSYIEDALMSEGYRDTARKYIEFRSQRDRERQKQSELLKQVQGLVEQTDENVLNQNANKKSSLLPTHRDLLAGILSKEFAKSSIPEHIIKEHEKGTIYVHDLDYSLTPLHNCGVYDFASLLDKGFTLGNAKIESPNSVGVATTVLSQLASTISSCSYGGQSIHRYNELLLPYVKKSEQKLLKEAEKYGLPDEWIWNKLRKEVYDAHQTFIYQINTICGTNGQTAFCTISLYPSDDPLVKMITEEYLKCHMKGLGKEGRTPTFPKVIYFVDKEKNLYPGTPNYDEFQLALQCSAKRMYPDYVMVESNKKMTGFSDVVTPMGCRSFVPHYEEDGKEKYTGRFNLGVVSLNLAYAAAEAKGDWNCFYKKLSEYADVAFQAHMDRINKLAKLKAKQNPIMWVEGALSRLSPEEEIGQLFYGGRATASLGYVGLAEALEIMSGEWNQYDALPVLEFLKGITEEWYKDTDIYFSLYGTPAESLCYTFANAIKKDFPELKFEHEYLTNSFHVPVRAKINIFEKLNLERDLYLFSSGGNVNNVEIPNLQHNIPALEAIVKEAYDKVNYLIINQPVDQCFKCEYNGEFNCAVGGFSCPSCSNTDDTSICVIRRVSGYIAQPNSQPFNRGKQSEVIDRIKHA